MMQPCRIGAGTSTVLRALLGLLEAQTGEVRWNGRRLADPAAFLVPPRAAYTPQVPTLFSGTLRENLLLGINADDTALHRAIDGAVLEADLATFPAGLETLIGIVRSFRWTIAIDVETRQGDTGERSLEGTRPCLDGFLRGPSDHWGGAGRR